MKVFITDRSEVRHIIRTDKLIHVEIQIGQSISEKHLIYIILTYENSKSKSIVVYSDTEEIKGSKESTTYSIEYLIDILG